jgi:catechol 2,3-dioxygenase-like lactoylglutathione lyase family enzyme
MLSRITHTFINVLDQDEALEFYVEKLGFEKRTYIPFGGSERWLEVAPPGAATTLAFFGVLLAFASPWSAIGSPSRITTLACLSGFALLSVLLGWMPLALGLRRLRNFEM